MTSITSKYIFKLYGIGCSFLVAVIVISSWGQDKGKTHEHAHTPSLNPAFTRRFIIIYDITSRRSFEALNEKREQILRVKDVDYVPIVVVGNKCDREEAREVTTEEGRELAKSWGSPFFEASGS